MTREEAIATLTAAILDKVKAVPKRQNLGDKHAYYTPPPLIIEGGYAGVQYKDVLRPSLHLSENDTVSLIEKVFWYILRDGDVTSAIRAVKDILPSTYASKVSEDRTPYHVLVRTLWLLGQQENYVTELSNDTILVSNERVHFGIQNHVAVSRFLGGTQVQVSPIDILKRSCRRRLAYDKVFLLMYREAHRLDTSGELARAVAVLKEALGVRFKQAFGIATVSRLTHLQREHLRKLIFSNKPDPFALVFKALVPEHMSKGEYSSTFGRMRDRSLDPSPAIRTRYFNKLLRHPIFGATGAEYGQKY